MSVKIEASTPVPKNRADENPNVYNWKSPKTWVTVKGYCINQKEHDKILLLLRPLDEIGDLLVEAYRSQEARLGLKIGSDAGMQMFHDLPEVEGAMMVRLPKDFPLNKIKVILTRRKCNMEARILWWDRYV